MLEIEIKLPLYRRNATEHDLVRLGFMAGDLVRESDIYFTGASHDFKKTDEALRIRRCENLSKRTETAFLTYKGPKLDRVSMTRKELETPVEDPEVMRQILLALGYEELAPVVKLRQYYEPAPDSPPALAGIHACADQVEKLGSFLELEVLAGDEADRIPALKRIENILKALGYSMEDTTRYSYLGMLQGFGPEIDS